MSKGPTLTDAERRLFRGAVAGATPLGSERGERAKPGQPLATAKAAVDPADKDLFRQAMSGTTPLQVDRAPHYHHPRPARPRPTPHETAAIRIEMLSGDLDPGKVGAAEALWFARPGLQQSVLRRLRRGRVSIGAELDLHGMIVAQAHRAVDTFITEAQQNDIRGIRIIHGKGSGSLHQHPVLKNKVDHWLRHCDRVLAFASARPEDGGTGAVYVLLKRQ